MRQLLKAAKIEPPYVLVGMFLSGLFVRLFAYQYPAEVAGMVQTKIWQALAQESDAFQLSLEQVRQARSHKPFPDIPLVVLSSTKPDFGANQELLQVMKELHLELANESSQGIHLIIPNSVHIIQLDRPETVIQAIYQVVEKVRNRFLQDK